MHFDVGQGVHHRRKRLAQELDTLRVAVLQHHGDAGVQFAPAPEGEPLVCAVADQRMPETERTRHIRVALDELGKPIPGLGV